MRKRQAKKRPLLPDPKFNDQLVTRFVNNLMWDGKKSTAFKVFYDALEIVETKKTDAEKSALETWKDALTNVMPHVEVRSRRVGGATFQIPMQIRPDRKVSMAIKWLILYARKRNEKSMANKLAAEILAAAKEEGAAVKKRMDTHKSALQRILMLVKRQQLSVSYFILVKHIKLVRFMMVHLRWTGWNKKLKEVLPLLQLQQLVLGIFQQNKEKLHLKLKVFTSTLSIPQDTLTSPLK
jgi:small subunit ribosomal protein S7